MRLYDLEGVEGALVQEGIEAEFSLFKTAAVVLLRDAPRKLSMYEFWAWIIADEGYCKQFPAIIRLAVIGMVIPVQTAVVERGFSYHRVIKTRLRNSLRLATIDSLLRVALLSAPFGLYDFTSARQLVKVPMAERGVGKLMLAAHSLILPDFVVDEQAIAENEQEDWAVEAAFATPTADEVDGYESEEASFGQGGMVVIPQAVVEVVTTAPLVRSQRLAEKAAKRARLSESS